MALGTHSHSFSNKKSAVEYRTSKAQLVTEEKEKNKLISGIF